MVDCFVHHGFLVLRRCFLIGSCTLQPHSYDGLHTTLTKQVPPSVAYIADLIITSLKYFVLYFNLLFIGKTGTVYIFTDKKTNAQRS